MFRRLSFVLIAITFLFFGCGDSNNSPTGPGTKPVISGMTPATVSRGAQNVAGTIQGSNLSGIVSVDLGPGITVQQKSSTATEITIKFSVANDAPAGAHTISVSTSGGTATSTTVFTVSDNRAPDAAFVVSPTSGAKNTVFVFDATTSSDPDGTVKQYKWNFGDGKSGNGITAKHQFAAAGKFDVTLTVTDNDGGSAAATKSVTVAEGQAPVAKFTVTPSSGGVGTKFSFDASASTDDGQIVSYRFDFGDGSAASGVAPTHAYTKDGLFHVVLTLKDNDNLSSALSKDLRVEKFDEGKNVADIQKLLERFFKRFAELDHLSAETIVEGWSTDSDCKGRSKEIDIIEAEQEIVQRTTADIIAPIDVFIHPDHISANATVTAHFDFVKKNGDHGSGSATHQFTLIFQDNEWQVCNFSVSSSTNPEMPFAGK